MTISIHLMYAQVFLKVSSWTPTVYIRIAIYVFTGELNNLLIDRVKTSYFSVFLM